MAAGWHGAELVVSPKSGDLARLLRRGPGGGARGLLLKDGALIIWRAWDHTHFSAMLRLGQRNEDCVKLTIEPGVVTVHAVTVSVEGLGEAQSRRRVAPLAPPAWSSPALRTLLGPRFTVRVLAMGEDGPVAVDVGHAPEAQGWALAA